MFGISSSTLADKQFYLILYAYGLYKLFVLGTSLVCLDLSNAVANILAGAFKTKLVIKL